MKAKHTSKPAPPIEITAEERYHLINDAVYFRSLQHQSGTEHPADQAESWCEVESEIDGVLKQHHAKP
ncbi:MAG: hypothetical protein ABI547_02310 [Betaproteobacteria bacterium]